MSTIVFQGRVRLCNIHCSVNGLQFLITKTMILLSWTYPSVSHELVCPVFVDAL
jgi:hypothetical protein